MISSLNFVIGQGDSVSSLSSVDSVIVAGIEVYRTDLGDRKGVLVKQLYRLLDWPEAEEFTENQLDSVRMIFDKYDTGGHCEILSDKLEEFVPRKLVKIDWLENYKDIQARLISTNRHLHRLSKFLTYYTEVENDEEADSLNLAQLIFLGVTDGDRILDIGASMGTVGFLLGSTYSDLYLVQNEIKRKRIKFLEYEKKKIGSLRPGSKIVVVKGIKKSTKVEEEMFDKILMINTMHHMSRPEHMLKSVMKSMNATSELIIIENLISNTKGCSKEKHLNYFEEHVSDRGLRVTQQEVIDDVLYMKCMLSSKLK